ncbi:MAG: aldo/keto reductase [Bacillota bacterium]|nr:aldo/keto reductase [Bacillota bacterium]
MKYLQFNELKISKLVLGTDYYGTSVDVKTSYSLLNGFTESGGNCIDTARVYSDGTSESLIGEWLNERNNRHKIILVTKGGHPLNGHSRLSRENLTLDIDSSLNALKTDYIDIYFLHRDDTNRPIEEIMETLSEFIKSGKVRYIGCSNWTSERIEAANLYSKSSGLSGFSISQIQWSLAVSTPEAHGDPTLVCMNDKEYNWYLENNFPVMAFSSQAKGFFTRTIKNGLDSNNNKALSRFLTEENLKRLVKVRECADKFNITPTAAALGYITCNALPAVAIIGCKNINQLHDSLSASDVDLPSSAVDELNNL